MDGLKLYKWLDIRRFFRYKSIISWDFEKLSPSLPRIILHREVLLWFRLWLTLLALANPAEPNRDISCIGQAKSGGWVCCLSLFNYGASPMEIWCRWLQFPVLELPLLQVMSELLILHWFLFTFVWVVIWNEALFVNRWPLVCPLFWTLG